MNTLSPPPTTGIADLDEKAALVAAAANNVHRSQGAVALYGAIREAKATGVDRLVMAPLLKWLLKEVFEVDPDAPPPPPLTVDEAVDRCVKGYWTYDMDLTDDERAYVRDGFREVLERLSKMREERDG
jgi:hypothetical protein